MSKEPLALQIWYAGLGALARAEKEGNSWIETLIEEGKEYESTNKDKLSSGLNELEQKATSRTKRKFENIENSFEAKVSQSLSKIGLMTKPEFEALKEKLSKLEEQINQKE